MSAEIAFMLALIVGTLVLFALEVVPIEVTALSVLGTLLVTGIIDADDAIAGLSNKAVVTVGAMLVLSQALVKTGVLTHAADRLGRLAGDRAWLGIGALLVTAGALSGFLNNTAVVAIFIPLATDLCRRFHVSPSKVLMPLSYASIFGGTLTLIGTSTNLLVSAIAEDHGLAPIGMFELTRLGAVLLVTGLAYVLVASPRLLPTRSLPEALTRQYRMGAYLTEVRVPQGSPLVGRTIKERQVSRRHDVTVLAVLRGDDRITENIRHLRLAADDILIVRGDVDALMRFRGDEGVALLSDVKLTDEEFSEEGQFLAEAIVGPGSRLIGKTLQQFDFRQRVGAFVLAIRRRGEIFHEKIAHIPLRFADDLLLVAPQERLEQLRHSDDIIVLSERTYVERRTGGTGWVIFVILPAVVVLAALGVVDILKAAILGTIALFLLRAMRPQEAYRSLDWSVLLLIAAFVPMGHAMEATGTAAFLASGILGLQQWWPALFTPPVLVAVLYLGTSLMTQTISNNATAILVAPIAIQLAGSLGIDPRPFLVAVAFAASAEFMTPHGYQTNLMVYGPGGYRFLDYTRFGAPLNLLFWLLASALIPLLWSF